MELIKLSKFKLQLRALISEIRELRDKERSASDQLHLFVQGQKQAEEEFNRKLTELQSKLTLSNELRQKLEMKVNYLQNDNALIENKQKELKETINSLLQSRERFVKAYEDSTCEMKRSIESRDRQIAVLNEKINAHLLLVDSIAKEAFFVKQIVDNAQHVLCEKEEVVAGLMTRVDKLSTFESLFLEKIGNLESTLRTNEDELRRKDKIILELEAQLEAAKDRYKSQQPQREELQDTLSAKELIIQNLMSEKKALLIELGSLEVIIKKFQETITHMDEENRGAFSLTLVNGEECPAVSKEDNRIEDVDQNCRVKCPHEAFGRAVAEIADAASPMCNPSRNNNHFDSAVSGSACSSPRSACSEPQVETGVETKGNCTTSVYQLDSECSTTQVENP